MGVSSSHYNSSGQNYPAPPPRAPVSTSTPQSTPIKGGDHHNKSSVHNHNNSRSQQQQQPPHQHHQQQTQVGLLIRQIFKLKLKYLQMGSFLQNLGIKLPHGLSINVPISINWNILTILTIIFADVNYKNLFTYAVFLFVLLKHNCLIITILWYT